MAPPIWAWKGTSTASITTAAIPYPVSGVLAGDIPILVVISKASSGTGEPPAIADPTGFTKLFEAWGGTGTAGTDTGPVKVTVWRKTTDADGSENGTSVSVVNPSGSSMVYGNIHGIQRATPGSTVVTAFASGQDAVADTSWSVTCGSDPGIQTDDLLLWLAGGCVNPTSTFTVEAITATGCTFGTMTEQEDAASATGFGARRVVATMACTAGPSSAAPVLTATTASASQTGVGAVLRIRELPAAAMLGSPRARFAPGRGPRAWTRFPRQQQGVISIAGQTFTQSLAGSLTPAGALTKQTSKPLAGSTTPAGALTKLCQKALAGVPSPTGALTLLHTIPRVFAGAVSPTGALTKLVAKPLAGSTTPTGSLTKLVAKALSGSITPTGVLTVIRLIVRAFAGSVTPAGALSKSTSKPLAASTTPGGGLAKLVAKKVAGAITPSGVLTKTRLVSLLLGGVIGPTGALVKRAGKVLGGLLSPSGALGFPPPPNVPGSFGSATVMQSTTGTVDVGGATSTSDVQLGPTTGGSALSGGSEATVKPSATGEGRVG